MHEFLKEQPSASEVMFQSPQEYALIIKDKDGESKRSDAIT